MVKEANEIQIKEAVRAFLNTGRKEVKIVLFNEVLGAYVQMVVTSASSSMKYRDGDQALLVGMVEKLYNNFCEKTEGEVLVSVNQSLICIGGNKICYVTFSLDK